MIFIEPPSVYAARLLTAKPGLHAITQWLPSKPPFPVQKSNGSFWTNVLMETLQLEGNVPVLITSLVNSAAKWGDYGRRADRENRKLQLFSLVGRLIKEGQLRRIARNYVLITTAEERKRQQESPPKLAVPPELPAPSV